MARLWTIIGVADVATSFAWYQTLLGFPQTAPAHEDFGQISDRDGTVVLCLHQWGSMLTDQAHAQARGHVSLTSPDVAKPGNGLLLFFRIYDFAGAWQRAHRLSDMWIEEPKLNPATGTLEFELSDPDGYRVMISAQTHDS